MKLLVCLFGLSVAAQTLDIAKERALGEGLAKEFRRNGKPLPLPEANAYVERVGSRLAAVAGREFRFEVLTTTGLQEPAALPGGTVIVPASLLLAVDDEAEFAGILAHAMGHSVLRHGTMPSDPAKTGAIRLFFAATECVHESDTSLIPMGFVETARKNELAADAFGVELAERAGYDPSGLRRYVRRLQPAAARKNSALPQKEARLEALDGVSNGIGLVSGAEFLRVREQLRDLLGFPAEKARAVPRLRR